MKKFWILVLALALTVGASTEGQEGMGRANAAERAAVVSMEVESAQQLLASGWEEIEPGVFRHTFEDGRQAEVRFGAPALEQVLAELDTDIEALRSGEELTADEELQLLELLIRREQLEQVEVQVEEHVEAPTKSLRDFKQLCGGTAEFIHTYGWESFAYPQADARTTWQQWISLSQSITTYAKAEICTSSNCYTSTDTSDPGFWRVTSFASGGSAPTWTCTASALGAAFVNGTAGANCESIVTYSSNWTCGDPIP